MRIRITAILAGLALAVNAAGDPPATTAPGQPAPPADDETPPVVTSDPVTLDPPVEVAFRPRAGVRQRGVVTRFDDIALQGPELGRHEWAMLPASEIETVWRRLADREDPILWARLGGVLLQVENGEKRAAQAFARVRRLAPVHGEAIIDQVRAAHAARLAAAAAAEAEAAARRLRTGSPEAGPFGATPWPQLSEDDQGKARATTEQADERLLRRGGVVAKTYPTAYFTLYTDAAPTEALQWALLMDKAVERLAMTFQVRRPDRHFWGKPAVLVLTEWAPFALVEASAFKWAASEDTPARIHYDGPRCTIVIWRASESTDVRSMLLRQTTFAFMHRWLTPRRPPAWALEGLATWVADRMHESSMVSVTTRKAGRTFVRSGGDLGAVASTDYADPAWSEKSTIVDGVGYLVTDLMIEQRPEAYIAWMRALKQGAEWRTALREVYGVTAEELFATAAAFYRVNE